MTVAIVIPTIPGREADLERCVAAYETTAPDARLIIEHDHPSCGSAWVHGAAKAALGGFDYLHFTADDLEPHAGWLETAVETVDKAHIPAPLVLDPAGNLESAGLAGFTMNRATMQDWAYIEGTTVPFVSREMWETLSAVQGFTGTLQATHYCTDLMFSTAALPYGWRTVIRSGMVFTHHTAPAGRNYARSPDDTRVFINWTNTLGRAI